MLQTLRRWLHQQLCPHATWLPCPESPGRPSALVCACCGKLRTIKHRYSPGDNVSDAAGNILEIVAVRDKIRRGETTINAVRAKHNGYTPSYSATKPINPPRRK
jgi:hypothetical protein